MSVHGTARWASWDELRGQGLLGSRGGLFLGFAYISEHEFEPLRYSGDLHQLIVAGTGGGKFTDALAPMLLGSGLERQTVVVVDPKAEIAKLTGPFFQQPFAPKRNVFLLDPWDQGGTGRTSALNVLADITVDNPNYVDDARALADAMIIPSGSENKHWDNAARNFLASIILFVALDPSEDGRRHLIRVRDLVTMTWAMPRTYKGRTNRETLSALVMEHLTSDLAAGAIRRGFSSIMNREDKERSGILSSIERDTAWIDSPQMQKVLEGPSLDLSEVGAGGNKYYVILPPDYFMTHRGWLRLVVTAFAKAMKRYRPPPNLPQHARWRHIVIDEFATLGEMSFIQDDVAVARGFDVKYTFAIQDLAQLERNYEKGWQSFINNSFQRFFAVGDMQTADYVSRMLGPATVNSVSVSKGQNTGDSYADAGGETVNRGTNFGALFGPATHSGGIGKSVTHTQTVTRGWTEGTSVSPIKRPLNTPDEVRRLQSPFQFLFVRGLHPFVSWCPPYWKVFRSLPPYTLAQVLATVGQPPPMTRAIAQFTKWRGQTGLLKPARRPVEWRVPGLVPGFLKRALKAAAFLVVTGLLCYAAVWFLFDASAQPLRDRFVALFPAPPPPPPVVKPPPTVQARLEEAFPSVVVNNAWEMARSRAADDPFMRAIDEHRDPKNNFVLRFAFLSSPHAAPVELAVVCATPPGDVTWVVDIRRLTMLAGELNVAIFLQEGAQPSEVRLGGGVRVFALTNAESATSHVLTARVRELSRPSGPEERIEFAHPRLERAKPFCDLQRQLLGTR